VLIIVRIVMKECDLRFGKLLKTLIDSPVHKAVATPRCHADIEIAAADMIAEPVPPLLLVCVLLHGGLLWLTVEVLSGGSQRGL